MSLLSQKRKLLRPAEKMVSGMDDLFRELCAVFMLKISYCNGDMAVSFSEARCNTKNYLVKFPFPSFFQETLVDAAESIPTEDVVDAAESIPTEDVVDAAESKPTEDVVDAAESIPTEDDRDIPTEDDRDIPEPDTDLFQNLLRVLEKGPDIARRLQKQIDKNKETAYTVLLAHHLLVPLSLLKDYTINEHSGSQITRCVCCKEEIAGKYGDTSMGHESMWHGSTDILIGQQKEVSVTVHIEEEVEQIDEEDEEYWSTSTRDLQMELIAKTIVFGLLRLKMNGPDENSLIPTIVITKGYVKIYFYDALHDYLLESCSMPLFTADGEDLQYSTIVALWLAINYQVTCTGLTKDVVESGFNTDFVKKFSEQIKYQYKSQLKFGNCREKAHVPDKEYVYELTFSEPLNSRHKCLTEKDYQLLLQKMGKCVKKETIEKMGLS